MNTRFATLTFVFLPLSAFASVSWQDGSWDLFNGASKLSSHGTFSECKEAAIGRNMTQAYTCRTSIALNVVASTPSQDPDPAPTEWTRCANEKGICRFAGARTVRYGAEEAYTYKTLVDGTPCSNDVFGDPLKDVVKHCDISAPSTTAPPPNVDPDPPSPPVSHPPPTGTGSAGISLPNLTASNVTSRTSCVAPCAVLFDAQTTLSTATSRPFHELLYQWDFGDPVAGGSGTCTDGNPMPREAGQGSYCTGVITGNPNLDSKNHAEGPVAAHVFETAGTYTVSLTASQGDANFNGTLDAAEYKRATVTITVSDPNVVYAGKTTCVSASGTFTGCPSGASQVTGADADAALNSALATGARRVLFRRGDVFTIAGASGQVSQQGPGIIGAFGTGNKPVFNVSMTHAFRIGNGTPGVTDGWTLMDVKCVYPSDIGNSACLYLNQRANNTLMLRVDSVNTTGFKSAGGEAFGNAATSGLWDGIFLVDGTIKGVANSSGNNGNYITGFRVAMIGYHIDMDNKGEHGTRTYANRVVESHNSVEDTVSSGRVGLTNRSFDWAGGGGAPAGTYSGTAVISNNRIFNVASTFGWGSTNASTDARLRDVIVERNYMESRDNLFRGGGERITLRNNIDNVQASAEYSFMDVQGVIDLYNSTGQVGQCPGDIWIYNNTAYGMISARSYVITWGNVPSPCHTPTPTKAVVYKNNLIYMPNTSNNDMEQSYLNTQANVTSCTTCNTQASDEKRGGQLFQVPTPGLLRDFTPEGTSYANGRGTSVPVWTDFYGRWQPARRDIGAVIH